MGYEIGNITVKQRIILHLSSLPPIYDGDEYAVPADLTQQGIASAVGIKRAHVSIDLKKLEEKKLVTHTSRHVNGTLSKMYAYTLLPKGRMEAMALRDRIEESGYTVDMVLDMRRCDAVKKWDSLSKEDRDAFGYACVMRLKIPRSDLPPTTTGIITEDKDGMINLNRDSANLFLGNADAAMLQRWHSWAADYWLMNNNSRERLYHLVRANRHKEANWLAMKMRSDVFMFPTKDLLDTLLSLKTDDDSRGTISWLCAQLAIACKMPRKAAEIAEILKETNEPGYNTVMSQVSMMSKDYNACLEYARKVYPEVGGALPALLMADAYGHLGNINGAELYAIKAGEESLKNFDGIWIDEILRVRAGVAFRRGNREQCLELLREASYAAPAHRKDRLNELILKAGTRNVRSEFGVLPQ